MLQDGFNIIYTYQKYGNSHKLYFKAIKEQWIKLKQFQIYVASQFRPKLLHLEVAPTKNQHSKNATIWK